MNTKKTLYIGGGNGNNYKISQSQLVNMCGASCVAGAASVATGWCFAQYTHQTVWCLPAIALVGALGVAIGIYLNLRDNKR